MQRDNVKNFMPDTKTQELRNRLMEIAKQIDGELEVLGIPLQGLLRETTECIDSLREYAFASDLDIEHWEKKWGVDTKQLGVELQKEINRARLLDEALQESKKEVVGLREKVDALQYDKEFAQKMAEYLLEQVS